MCLPYLLYVINSSRIMLLRIFITLCIQFAISNFVNSQSLYRKNSQQHNDLNRDSNNLFLQSSFEDIEDLLKGAKVRFRECKSTELSVSDSYNQLLIMDSKGIFPIDYTIDGICEKNPRLIFKSDTDCHRYYDCSEEDTQLSSYRSYNMWPAKHKHECHFPFMFSEDTLQCENYTKVSCGRRYKPTWECRYFRLQCKFSSCIPCDYRYPKCEDKDDGIFMATGKDIDFTRKYMVCKDKRRISTDFCPYAEHLWGGPTYLYKGKCSHLYEIPTDFNENGRLPSCKGKLNGNYQFPDRPCDAYYRCLDGIASPLLCPYGTVFDVKMKNCLRRGNCTFS